MYEGIKKLLIISISILFISVSHSQTISNRLVNAFRAFEADPQLTNAISSLYVIDAETGKVVFEKNAGIGMAPASTQKIITAAAAYEILGKDFRYETKFGYRGSINNGKLDGNILVRGSGDPTLGSWRWPQTSEQSVISRLVDAVGRTGIKNYRSLVVDANGWEAEDIPGGWNWDDIGNYYGAGAGIINWRENQFDLFLKSGADTGSFVTVAGTQPLLYGVSIISKATAAGKGSGDNAYIYFQPGTSTAVVRGTIPAGENKFTISGSIPSGNKQFLSTFSDSLQKKGVVKEGENLTIDKFNPDPFVGSTRFFHTETSPRLDSINYWFLKRSINLYGEALIKTIASVQGFTASIENGADAVRDFWVKKQIGISKTELNMGDGSGLSPQNRVTTKAQVAILRYAKTRSWFDGYLDGFPEFNKMKMKSGTIGGVKGFCGYHRSASGKEYIFSFLVNNYNGSSSSLVQKMYKVLDVLK